MSAHTVIDQVQETPKQFLWNLLKKHPLDLAKAVTAVFFTALIILTTGYGIRTLVDQGLSEHNQDLLNFSALLLIALAMGLSVTAYLRTSTTAKLSEKVASKLRHRLFEHIMALPIVTFEEKKLGDLLSHFNTDCEHIRNFVSGSAAVAIRTLLQLLGGTTLLIISSPKLTLYVFSIIPLVIIPITLFGKRVKKLTFQAQELDGVALAFAEERFNAITMMKSFTVESRALSRFSRLLDDKLELVHVRTHYRSLLISMVIALVFSAIALILWVGAKEVLNDNLSPGQLSAFIFYAVIVAGSLNNFAEVISDYNTTLGSTERLTKILAIPTETTIEDTPPTLRPFQSLEFKNVTFSYPSRPDIKVLDKLSFKVDSGEKVALVGPSGVGKSTLFKLLLRFYTPDSGKILLNGKDIQTYSLQDLRATFGLVPQDPIIFNTSVHYNMTLGIKSYPQNVLSEVSQKAYVNEFAEKFPEKYQTMLGEKGVRLSGGQKQRIALARAMLKDAPCFLLDEATNSLDSKSEAKIQSALKNVLKDRSALIIAHRLSTVKEADQIIVIANGTIDAVGKHAALMKKSSLYKTLAQQQFLEE